MHLKKFLKREYQKIQTDKGREFYNKLVKTLFQKKNINHYSTHSETKAAVAERFNKTLKNKIYRLFTFRQNYKYIDKLKNIVKSYNQSFHRSIGMAPSRINPSHHSRIFEKLYKMPINQKFKFLKLVILLGFRK